MARKSFRERLLDTEKRLLAHYLERAGGSVNRAAEISGLHRSVIRRLVIRHHLEHMLHRAKRPPVYSGNAEWHALADA